MVCLDFGWGCFWFYCIRWVLEVCGDLVAGLICGWLSWPGGFVFCYCLVFGEVSLLLCYVWGSVWVGLGMLRFRALGLGILVWMVVRFGLDFLAGVYVFCGL